MSIRWRYVFRLIGTFLLLCLISYIVLLPEQTFTLLALSTKANELEDRIFVSESVAEDKSLQLQKMVAAAQARVADFLNDTAPEATIILVAVEDRPERYGLTGNKPGLTHTSPFGAYIVLTERGLNVDVIAHELMHAELHQQFGWWLRQTEVPTWFDEGLALMVDYRFSNYEQVWLIQTQNGKLAPTLDELADMPSFIKVTEKSPILSYYTAMREVREWWQLAGPEGLAALATDLKDDTPFAEAYAAAAKAE